MARLSLLAQARETADMIKVSHSIFALPFALAAGALAMRATGGWSWPTVFWIVVCAVCARTAAMAANRLFDARLDAANPRTVQRALPAGRVTKGFVVGLIVASAALFVWATTQLNELVFRLSFVALAVVLLYPLTKRYTALCHLWLGIALALAPIGAWLAVRGAWVEIATPLLFGAGVMLWTAGFDLIYACQDAEHDRSVGLHSIPGRIGIAASLKLSVVLHVLCVACLAAVFWTNPHVGWLYGAGLAAAVALLAYEHAIVSPTDLSRVDVAFFTLNGFVSLVLGASTVADAFW